jgi:hypothetical protein
LPVTGYLERVPVQGARVPVPPDGLQTGQLDVAMLGRVIIGDVAAALAEATGPGQVLLGAYHPEVAGHAGRGGCRRGDRPRASR